LNIREKTTSLFFLYVASAFLPAIVNPLHAQDADSTESMAELTPPPHGLIATLRRVKGTSDRMGQKTVVVIIADQISPHYKAIEVLDACAAANIQHISFGDY
jgi:hypothetical protein